MRTMPMIQDKKYVNKLILTVRFQMMSEHLIRLQQVKKQFNQLSCIEAEIFNCNHFFDLMFCTVKRKLERKLERKLAKSGQKYYLLAIL